MVNDNETEELFKLLTLSRKRRNVMNFLSTGPKTLSEINDALDQTSASILPEIRKVEQADLLVQEKDTFRLTQLGKVMAYGLDRFESLNQVIADNKEFWKEHDIESIPLEFRKRIHQLKDGKVIKSTQEDLFKPLTEFLDLLQESVQVKGVSPIFHPNYPELFNGIIDEGKEVSLILTEPIFQKTSKEHSYLIDALIQGDKTDIWVYEGDLKVAFCVSDSVLSLGFFNKDGDYDVYSDLIFHNESAVKWGFDLFDHFKNNSRRIDTQ